MIRISFLAIREMQPPVEHVVFVVPIKHVPVFAAAVQCLGKIGKELYLEMSKSQVSQARVDVCGSGKARLSGSRAHR